MPTPCLPDFTIPNVDQKFGTGETKNSLLDAVPENHRKDFTAIYNDYKKECKKIQKELADTLKNLPEGDSSLIRKTLNDWKNDEQDLETLRAQTREKLVALKKAEREFDAAAKASGSDIEKQFKKATTALKYGIEALNVICKLGGALPTTPASGAAGGQSGKASEKDKQNLFSVSLACGKKREALDQLIEAVATGQNPAATDADASLKQATTIAAALPGIIKDVSNALKAGERVPLSHLTLLKQQASIDLEFARRKVSRQEKRVAMMQQKWRAAVAEAFYLWQTRNWLCDASAIAANLKTGDKQIACETLEVLFQERLAGQPGRQRKVAVCRFHTGGWVYDETLGFPLFKVEKAMILGADKCLLAKSYEDAIKTNKAVARSIKMAAANYALASESAEADLSEAGYRIRALAGEEALDYDERALRLWAELIAIPVNSLSAHYAAGLRAESIASVIVNAAGLAAIGVGVNR